MTGREEEYQEEEATIDAWPAEEEGAREKEEDEYGRRVRRDEEDGEPTVSEKTVSIYPNGEARDALPS